MKKKYKLLKYIILILIGIVLYTILNTYEGFNIGAPWVYFSEPFNRNNSEKLLSTAVRSGGIQGEAVMYQYIQDNINDLTLLPNDYNIFKVGYDVKTPPDLSLEQLNSGIYSTRKIEPLTSPLTSNSEFYIKVYKPIDSALLDTRDEAIDYQLIFDRYYTSIDTHDNNYKLVITDHLSLLKVFSLILKYYIKYKHDDTKRIPRPILYMSCHGGYIEQPISVSNWYDSDDPDIHDRVIKVHEVDQGGCTADTIANILNYSDMDPRGFFVAGSDMLNVYNSQYSIPLYFDSNEFTRPTHESILSLRGYSMAILYKNTDNNYMHYGSDIFTHDNQEKYNKKVNIMRLFGLTTMVGGREVPILLKSYNSYSNSFSSFDFTNITGLYNLLVTRMNCFPNAIKPMRPEDDNSYTKDYFPLHLFLNACINYDQADNAGRSFYDIAKTLEGYKSDDDIDPDLRPEGNKRQRTGGYPFSGESACGGTGACGDACVCASAVETA